MLVVIQVILRPCLPLDIAFESAGCIFVKDTMKRKSSEFAEVKAELAFAVTLSGKILFI